MSNKQDLHGRHSSREQLAGADMGAGSLCCVTRPSMQVLPAGAHWAWLLFHAYGGHTLLFDSIICNRLPYEGQL